MKKINLDNYIYIFGGFSEKEKIDFIQSYEMCLNDLARVNLQKSQEKPAQDFLEKWGKKFKNREDLLRQTLTLLSPKEMYAIMDLCK